MRLMLPHKHQQSNLRLLPHTRANPHKLPIINVPMPPRLQLARHKTTLLLQLKLLELQRIRLHVMPLRLVPLLKHPHEQL
jgi:hypothetical protein